MVIVIAFSDRIAREESLDEQEHNRHADEADHDDQWVGLQIHLGEGGKHFGIEGYCRQRHPATCADLLALMPEHAEVDDRVNHQIEEGPKRSDPAEVKTPSGSLR